MNSGKNKQYSTSFVTILLVSASLALAASVGAQGLPADAESGTMGQTLDKLKVARTLTEMDRSFDATAPVDALKSIASNGLGSMQESTQSVISFTATNKIYLATSAFLLTQFAGSSH